MLLLALTFAVLATAPKTAPEAAAPVIRPQYPSEEALRRYAQGRFLEESGRRDMALGEYARALVLDEKSGSLARRMSEASAINGEPARSLEFAERAIALDRNDARAQWLKGTALINLGRQRESLEPLQAATALDSERVEYQRTLGRAAESVDRLDLAVKSYRRTVWLDPDDAESWFQLAAGEARLGHFGAADSALTEVAELNPMRPGLAFLQGWVNENMGRSERAMELYRQHLLAHPNDVETRRRAVSLLARDKRYEEAWREARTLARDRPDDRESSEIEADLAYLAGHAADGDKVVDRMRKRWPDDVLVMASTIALLGRHGRAARAVKEAEAWAAARPENYHGHLIAGRARTLNKQPAEALAHFRRAVEIAPDSLPPRLMLARFFEQEKRLPEAEKVWTEAQARFPDHNGVAFDLAGVRERIGDLAGAETAVRDVLKREPENPTALNFLGYLWADHNQNLDQAVDLIGKAITADPDNGAYIDSLGWAYYRMGRLAEARVQLERAVRLTSGDAVVLEHLGDVYKDLSLKDLALKQYRQALAADPDNARLRAKLEALR
ncbi:MAG TPA: tetratricopeptide repeat protein [Candidatus Eisenbacteria bacterium]|nr:tetratricopeptide repeat protein [Candidatus Eisenbacteria bacterium]